jgi:hypothetical protein
MRRFNRQVVVGDEIVERVSLGELYGAGYSLEDYFVRNIVFGALTLISEVDIMLRCVVQATLTQSSCCKEQECVWKRSC